MIDGIAAGVMAVAAGRGLQEGSPAVAPQSKKEDTGWATPFHHAAS
jgi:hypothetical protein